MTDRTDYSLDQKAQVIADVMAGLLTVTQAANKYKIPRGTVAAWISRVDSPVLQQTATARQQIGAKIMAYLGMAYDVLMAQLKVMGDESWLRKQTASDITTLHNTVHDNSIRLLEALSPGDEGEAEDV